MKETVGTTWTFQLIVIFILIFACFLTLVISYSKAFSVKNSVLTMVEKYEGVTNESLEIINNYLNQTGYKTVGICSSDWYGVTIDGECTLALKNKKYVYCFKENTSTDRLFYDLKFFYKFNLPFIGELKTFVVNGRTSTFIGSDDRITKED